MKSAWIFFIVSIIGLAHINCGKHPSILGSKDHSAAETHALSADPRKIALYENYIRIRDGSPRTEDHVILLNQLNEYRDNYQNTLLINEPIIARATEDCKRFINLYHTVHEQLINGLDHVLYSTSRNEKNLYEARVRILQSFENSLVAFALTGAESGQSFLDSSAKKTCQMPDRKKWQEAVWKTHQSAYLTQTKFFGEHSLTNPYLLSTQISPLKEDKRRENQIYSIGFQVVELIGIIAFWEYALIPSVNKISQTLKLRKGLAWGLKAVSSVGLMIGWVHADEYFQNHLPFLKPAPVIENENLGEWDKVLTLGEEFTESPIDSPLLYSPYLALIDVVAKQAAVEFLHQNQSELLQAEKTHGTIDNALRELKTLQLTPKPKEIQS